MNENEQRDPIRRTRWIGWFLGILIVLLLTGHAIWNSIAASRLQGLIAIATAAGEPVYPLDFAVSAVNAPDNAGTDIVAAAQMLQPASPEWQKYNALRESLGVPLRGNEREAIEAVTPVLGPALGRSEAARGKTRIDWDVDVTSPVANHLPPPMMNEIRGLANAVQIQTLSDYDHGRHRAALDRIEQTFLVSRLADRHPSLVGHLVAIGCTAIGSNTLLDIAADLKIGTGPDDATPEQVRGIINKLLDDQATTEGLRLAFLGERMMQLDFMNSMRNGAPAGPAGASTAKPLNPIIGYLASPVIHQNTSVMFRQMTLNLAAVPEKNWPEFQAKLPRMQRTGSLINGWSEMLMPSVDRAGETHFRALADRRLAAISLAVRWYSLEHDGQLPAKLEDLVPKYLPAIPMDPLASGSRPMGYIPKPGEPIVYSVGSDGADDGGSEAGTDPKRKVLNEWMMKDRVQPLYRRVRAEPEPEPEP